MINRTKLIILTFAATLIFPVAPSAYADPPPWAPAHGWRKKNDPYYVGYTGRKWGRDYEIVSGSCNREAIGTVLGGVVGGAVGSTIGKGDGKTVAIIAGVVLGAIIGNKIGKDMDNADRGCLGHSLELGADHRPVHWENPEIGLSYTVTPQRGFTMNGLKCREYDFEVFGDGVNESRREKACRTGPGNWKRYE
jgi:surface antigen